MQKDFFEVTDRTKLDYFKNFVSHVDGMHTPPKFTPCPRRSIVNLYTLFKTQDPENHTLCSCKYPYRPNKGVPPGSSKAIRLITGTVMVV